MTGGLTHQRAMRHPTGTNTGGTMNNMVPPAVFQALNMA
jgi:hypothetical protein